MSPSEIYMRFTRKNKQTKQKTHYEFRKICRKNTLVRTRLNSLWNQHRLSVCQSVFVRDEGSLVSHYEIFLIFSHAVSLRLGKWRNPILVLWNNVSKYFPFCLEIRAFCCFLDIASLDFANFAYTLDRKWYNRMIYIHMTFVSQFVLSSLEFWQVNFLWSFTWFLNFLITSLHSIHHSHSYFTVVLLLDCLLWY